MKRLRLVPDNTKIPFMGYRRVTLPFSLATVVVAILVWTIVGLNFGIDFSGGTLIEARSRSGPADLAAVRSSVGNLDLGDVQVQEFGQPEDIMIRLPQQDRSDAEQQGAIGQVRALLGENYEIRRVETVGPSVSAELRRDGAIAVVITLALVLLYLWVRFEWQFAVGAVITTAHDAILTLGIVSAMQITFDLPILAAILTIIGYSLNDTVVIYDRIRENLRRYKQLPLPELIDGAINQTLSRTVATSLTTMLAALALFLFGGEGLRGFNFTMLVGMMIGVYSSVVISAPMLIYFGLRTQGSGTKAAKEAGTAASART